MSRLSRVGMWVTMKNRSLRLEEVAAAEVCREGLLREEGWDGGAGDGWLFW